MDVTEDVEQVSGASQSNVEAREMEVQQLKNRFGEDCRVIENIGDFACVVQVVLKQFDITIKFQISDAYPKEPAEVIVIDRNSSQTTASDLRQFLSESNQTRLMSDHLTMAAQWLTDHFRQSATSELIPTKSKGQNRRRKRVADVEMESSPKKESMKTAEDVIKRILWDSNLESENFSVGYLDRFLGLMEKNFSQFSWEDLASVDYTVLAIPKHRIQYFKYRKVIVWDKRKRLDNVFGSAGCKVTITDVIANYVEPETTSNDESEKGTPSEQSENWKVENDPLAENVQGNNTGDDDDDSDGDDDDDSDDGVCVTIDGKPDVGGEENSEDEAEDRRDPWQNKLRPNYFLCQRITDPQVLENVSAMQNQILDMDSRYLHCCIPPHMLHVTLCTLGLYQPEHIKEVAEILRENRDDLAEMAKSELSVDISGVGNFFERVVYGKVNHDEQFTNYAQHVCMLIREAGINICDYHEFVPHMTILKVTRPVARHVGTRKVASWMYEDFQTVKFGTQVIDGIYLCAMKGEKLPGKFYDSPAHISFV